MLCGLEFYPHEKVMFASDCPFDPEKGPGYIRETIKILDSLDMPKEKRDDIYYRNFEKLTGRNSSSNAMLILSGALKVDTADGRG